MSSPVSRNNTAHAHSASRGPTPHNTLIPARSTRQPLSQRKRNARDAIEDVLLIVLIGKEHIRVLVEDALATLCSKQPHARTRGEKMVVRSQLAVYVHACVLARTIVRA